MEDISTFIWIGIAVLWLLTRLVRGASKSARRSQRRPETRPTQIPAAPRSQPGRPAATTSYGGGQSAKPIEPR